MKTTVSNAPAADRLHARRRRSAFLSLSSHFRLWLVTALGLAADLWTKEWAFRTLSARETRSVVNGWLDMHLSLNPGALFGLGAGFAPVFIGASVLALMFVLYLFAHSTAGHRWLHIGLGLVLAGAMGNLYDRTMVKAYVWYDPQTRMRDIGTLLSEDELTVRIGDYPSGDNPRTHLLRPTHYAGPTPVVRDFLRITVQVRERSLWPWIFNIADALLVVGVAMLVLSFWREQHETTRVE
jgi:lipoprotein signal peptidase